MLALGGSAVRKQCMALDSQLDKLLAELDQDGAAFRPNARRMLGADVVADIRVGRLSGPVVVPIAL